MDVCPGIATTSPVEESSYVQLVMEKSGLKKKVEDEPYGSWMVVERWRGCSWTSMLNGEINGNDEVVTKERSNSEGDMWLGFPEKDVIETKGKQAKLRAKGSPEAQHQHANTTHYKQQRKPMDETLEIQEQQSFNLQLAMEGFVCDLERSPEKDVMVPDPQVVKKVMIVDDTDGVEVNGARADGIITKIGYPNSFKVEANSFAAGIWLCSNKDVMVDILNIHSQVVHVKIRSTMSSNNFFCSIAYASPHALKRRELWHFLSSLAVSVEGPWMLANDFNSILDGGERKCGASISRVGYKWFIKFLFDNALQDLGASGAKFAWCKGGLSQRLDMAIYNSEWDSFFPECSVMNLYILKFDHRPTLISLKLSVSKGLKPSRCLASWVSHVDFGN
ncbi:hypothetical protein Goarm_022485, partial [Gossypium armourianum]|nr:hypothetical protein [Gossypium armourianum]